MIQFNRRRFFKERQHKLPLRWVVWGTILVLFLVFVLFMKLFK